MSDAMHHAVEDAVIRAKCDGLPLIVGYTARLIAAQQGTSDEESAYRIARAIIEEAAQRGVAM